LSLIAVPEWLHTALMGLKDQIMSQSTENFKEAITQQMTALAPPGSKLVQKPKIFQMAIFVWIQFCLKPVWRNPTVSSKTFCNRFVSNKSVGEEYAVSYRLSRSQFQLYLEAYLDQLRRH
jgi:hypothetical protein